jgi:hypothetical protein
MLEAPVALFTEIIVPLFIGMVELFLMLLLASVRPWAYLLSPAVRARINAEFAHKPPALKLLHLSWGTILLVASIATVWGIVSFFSARAEDAPDTKASAAVELARKAARAAQKQFPAASIPRE